MDLYVLSIFTGAISLLLIILYYVFKDVRRKNSVTVKRILSIYQKEKSKIKFEEQAKWEEEFKLAGNPLGLTVSSFLLYRNIIFIIVFSYINLSYLSGDFDAYPSDLILMVVLIYYLLSFHRYSLLKTIMEKLKEIHTRKKNMEVFNLYQMFLNEFEQDNNQVYHIEYLMEHFSKHFIYIKDAIEVYLQNKERNPKKIAFDMFADEIGTPEAKYLSDILYEITQHSKEVGAELLENRYDDIKKKRQEYYRRKMKFRGMVGYILAFIGSVVVIMCSMIVYYLEWEDISKAIFQGGF